MIPAIIAAAAALAALIILLIFLLRARSRDRGEQRNLLGEGNISISQKGVDVKSGQLGGRKGSFLKGMPAEEIPTVLTSGEIGEKSFTDSKKDIRLIDEETGREYRSVFLTDIIIGRQGSGMGGYPSLIIPEPSISARHCRILVEKGQLWVEDLHSSNGTYLEGRRVAGMEPMRSGCRIRLGRKTYVAEIY